MKRGRTLEILETRIEELESSQEKARAAVIELYSFTVEATHLDKTSKYYEDGDESTPFFSESYLYNLLGKEDARTVLAYLHRVESPLGLRDGKPFPRKEKAI